MKHPVCIQQSIDAHVPLVIFKSIHKQLEGLKLDNKRNSIKKFCRGQNSKSHKTHSDKSYAQKAEYFAKDTKTEADLPRQESVNQIEDTPNNETEVKDITTS